MGVGVARGAAAEEANVEEFSGTWDVSGSDGGDLPASDLLIIIKYSLSKVLEVFLRALYFLRFRSKEHLLSFFLHHSLLNNLHHHWLPPDPLFYRLRQLD